jgi:8-oxo-dGTP pyrophosphatase MutT (NUDIX family)
MNKKDILPQIKKLAEKLPKFKDGRIDYTNAKKAAVLIIFVKHKEKILILKRSNKVHSYKGKWSTIAGFYDEIAKIDKKVAEELQEELKITKNYDISIGTPYWFEDKDIGKKWFRIPVIVKLIKPVKIKIDWEHSEYKWINPKDFKKYDFAPGMEENLKHVDI